MIIQCRHCGTKFKLAGPERQAAFKVKCSVCATTFTVESERENTLEQAVAVKTPKQPFDLVSEKQELDLFLSEILRSRPAEKETQEELVRSLPRGPEPIAPKSEKQELFPEPDRYSEIEECQSPQNIQLDGPAPTEFSDKTVGFETDENSGNQDSPVSNSLPEVTDISPAEEDAGSDSIPDLSKEILDGKRKEEPPAKKGAQATAFSFRQHLLGISALVILGAIAVFLWIYPQAGHEALRWASANVPGIDQVLETKTEKKADPIEKIQIIGLKQRFVVNSQIGKIRVIEGFVSNQSDTAITKVRLMARLYDARSTLLAAKVIGCGGILDEEALEKLSDQEMAAALGKPKDGQSERIEPKKNVPFMFVFANEPQGISQAFVVPLTAERAM